MYLLINKNSVLPFSSGKQYMVGTGYIALYDEGKEETVCCLCRILDKEEIQLYKTEKMLSSVCVLNSKEQKNSAVIPTILVIVLCHVDDVEEADKMVESYRKGLEALEQFRSD